MKDYEKKLKAYIEWNQNHFHQYTDELNLFEFLSSKEEYVAFHRYLARVHEHRQFDKMIEILGDK